MAELKIVILSPKFSEYEDHGKFHASKELLYSKLSPMIVPKASPLHVSKMLDNTLPLLPHQTFHITTPLELDFGSVQGLVT